MQTIRVGPVKGRRLPLETEPKRRVDREMDVPNTAYYRRAIARGDIERVSDKPAPKARPAREEG